MKDYVITYKKGDKIDQEYFLADSKKEAENQFCLTVYYRCYTADITIISVEEI